jgi:hypothetical protein
MTLSLKIQAGNMNPQHQQKIPQTFAKEKFKVPTRENPLV